MSDRRRSWPAILEHAAELVRRYTTGVTLRQLYYRLVADGTLPNTPTAYKQLSHYTAEGRRAGTFPVLIDRGREIHQTMFWTSPQEAREWLAGIYRRDRTEGQREQLWVGVEKVGLIELLRLWFAGLGIPIVALSGFASETYVGEIVERVDDDGRPAVLIYAGDFDPSGEDIERDFVVRTDCWDEVRRVALTEDQVLAYGLPEMPGKPTDSRAAGFEAKYGRLVQVELDALDPNDLRALYQDAIDEFMDTSAYEDAMAREDDDRASLR